MITQMVLSFVNKTFKTISYPCHISVYCVTGVTTSSRFDSMENYRNDAHQLIPLKHTVVQLKSRFLFHSLNFGWAIFKMLHSLYIETCRDFWIVVCSTYFEPYNFSGEAIYTSMYRKPVWL